jgi:hypothetical protein
MARPLPFASSGPVFAIAASSLALVVNMGMVEIQRQAKAG